MTTLELALLLLIALAAVVPCLFMLWRTRREIRHFRPGMPLNLGRVRRVNRWKGTIELEEEPCEKMREEALFRLKMTPELMEKMRVKTMREVAENVGVSPEVLGRPRREESE